MRAHMFHHIFHHVFHPSSFTPYGPLRSNTGIFSGPVYTTLPLITLRCRSCPRRVTRRPSKRAPLRVFRRPTGGRARSCGKGQHRRAGSGAGRGALCMCVGGGGSRPIFLLSNTRRCLPLLTVLRDTVWVGMCSPAICIQTAAMHPFTLTAVTLIRHIRICLLN